MTINLFEYSTDEYLLANKVFIVEDGIVCYKCIHRQTSLRYIYSLLNMVHRKFSSKITEVYNSVNDHFHKVSFFIILRETIRSLRTLK